MTDEAWPSSVDVGGPFVAERHESGWWIVVNARGEELDDSGDGGFTEKSARYISDALNDASPLRDRIAVLEGALVNARGNLVRALASSLEISDEFAAMIPSVTMIDAALNGEKKDG